MTGILSSVLERSTLRRWSKVVDRLDALDPEALSRVRRRARRLSQRLDEVIHVAEGRLAGADAVPMPAPDILHCDWTWRPDLWSGPVRPLGLAPVESGGGIGRDARVFHDCDQPELALRQVRNVDPEHRAAFGLRFDIFRFGGSFLSLALDLPDEVTADMTRRHVLRVDLGLRSDMPIEVFARLNLAHGPNTEVLVREMPGTGGLEAEFDLSEVPDGMTGVDRAWVDIIFEGPELNQIVLSDLVLSRRPRAAF